MKKLAFIIINLALVAVASLMANDKNLFAGIKAMQQYDSIKTAKVKLPQPIISYISKHHEGIEIKQGLTNKKSE